MGVVDECGVCNGPGPTEVVIEDITILYDSVYLPQLEEWYVYEFGADTIFGFECPPLFAEPYSLTIEPSEAVNPGNGTVYRFYVNAENETDKMSVVFGNDQANLVINTPENIYNHFISSSWNASGVHPGLLSAFPELADDSYATIGLEGPADDVPGADNPTLIEDVTLSTTVSNYFVEGGTELNVSTLTGASWYVLNTASNALPTDGRWLIAQITTTGSISGTINYQIFPLGSGEYELTKSVDFDGFGTFLPD